MYGNPLWSPTNNPYVPWNLDFIYKGVSSVLSNFGTAFNIGIYIFLIVIGIMLALRVISWLTGR